jgi:hypothetical protein
LPNWIVIKPVMGENGKVRVVDVMMRKWLSESGGWHDEKVAK